MRTHRAYKIGMALITVAAFRPGSSWPMETNECWERSPAIEVILRALTIIGHWHPVG